MAKITETKDRIESIKDTMKITGAMKLVSAAKLKKAKKQLEKTMPYFEKIELTMADILAHGIDESNIYFDKRPTKGKKRNGYLILSGDKGLCGSYNHNILKIADEKIKNDENPLLLVCGFMGRKYYMKKGYDVKEDFFYPVQNPNIYRSREIQEKIMELFKNGEIDRLFFVFTKLEKSFKLRPHIFELLPLSFESLHLEIGKNVVSVEKTQEELIYEPSKEEVFQMLVPKYIKGVVYGAFVEAFTSEQSARMTAMESSTRNAQEMIEKLELIYNRARQNSITQEITEIISGANIQTRGN